MLQPFRLPSLHRINRMGAGISLLLFILILLPLLAVLLQIIYPGFFFGEKDFAGFGLLLEVFRRPLWTKSLTNSLILGIGTAFIGTFIGGTLALIRSRWSFFTAKMLDITAWVLLIMPSFIIAQGWVLFSRAGGLAEEWLGLTWVQDLVFQPTGLIIVMALSKYSLAYIAIQAALEWNVSQYVDAARMNGASPWKAFRTIRLPLLIPPIIAGWSLVFMETIGDFGLPATLSAVYSFPTLPYTIYAAINTSPTRFDLAGVLAFYLVLIIVIALLFIFIAMQKARYDFLNNRAVVTHRKKTKWGLYLSSLNIVFITVSLGVPIGSSILISFMKRLGDGVSMGNGTFQHYVNVWSDASFQESLQNSLMIAGTAAVFSTVIGFVIAYVLYFTSSHLKGLINTTSLISLAVPGIVLSIGYIFIWNQPWLDSIGLNLYGTVWIMVLAAVAGAIPFAVRLQMGAFSSIPGSMLYAASLQGSGKIEQMTAIVLPFVRHALLASVISTFGASIFDLAIAAMLHPPGFNLLPVTIDRAFEQADYGYSTASTVVSAIIIIGIILIIDQSFKWLFKFLDLRKGTH